MWTRKMIFSVVIASIFGGAIGWGISNWYNHRIAYCEKLVFVRQIAPLTLYTLTDLSRDQRDQAFDRLERDLDTKLIVIGYNAMENGELGQEAREFIKQVAMYRSTSKYTPKSPSVKRRIDYILTNGYWDKP